MGRPIMIILSIVFGMALLSILYVAFSGPIKSMGSTIMAKSGDILNNTKIDGNGGQSNNGGQGIKPNDPFKNVPKSDITTVTWGGPDNGLQGKEDTRTGDVWFNHSNAHGKTYWITGAPTQAKHIYFSTPELTKNVTDMTGMFAGPNLTSVPQMDTRNVTNMNGMFENCYSLTSVPQMDTRNVTDMGNMFDYCNSLTSVPQMDTSNVKDMDGMFLECHNLTSVPQMDTRNVTDMRNMLEDCSSLDKSKIPSSITSNPNYSSSNVFD